tara:strand:- start:179 stop:412 length:234 start_codon:yes stop_codon:yes gene_type:complete
MEIQQEGVQCKIKRKNGDSYDSLYFGTFQYKDKDNEYPVASIKLQKGNLGFVKLDCVYFEPAPYIIDKFGKKIYFEE